MLPKKMIPISISASIVRVKKDVVKKIKKVVSTGNLYIVLKSSVFLHLSSCLVLTQPCACGRVTIFPFLQIRKQV